MRSALFCFCILLLSGAAIESHAQTIVTARSTVNVFEQFQVLDTDPTVAGSPSAQLSSTETLSLYLLPETWGNVQSVTVVFTNFNVTFAGDARGADITGMSPSNQYGAQASMNPDFMEQGGTILFNPGINTASAGDTNFTTSSWAEDIDALTAGNQQFAVNPAFFTTTYFLTEQTMPSFGNLFLRTNYMATVGILDTALSQNPSVSGSASFQGTVEIIYEFIPSSAFTDEYGSVTSVDLGTTMSAVPEPDTYASVVGLLSLGLVVGCRRRRTSRLNEQTCLEGKTG